MKLTDQPNRLKRHLNASTGDASILRVTPMSNVHTFRRPSDPGENDAINRQDIVNSLHEALNDAIHGLRSIPVFVRLAFEAKVWQQERIFAGGTQQPPVSFHAFVHEPYPRGLGSDYATVRHFLGSDPVALQLWDEASQRGSGRSAKAETVNNVNGSPERPQGNTAQAAVRRLRKAAESGDTKAADLLEMVQTGAVKPNAAAIDMGWRKKTITVVDEPGAFFDAVRKRLPHAEIARRAIAAMTPAAKQEFVREQNPELSQTVSDLKRKLKDAESALKAERSRVAAIEGRSREVMAERDEARATNLFLSSQVEQLQARATPDPAVNGSPYDRAWHLFLALPDDRQIEFVRNAKDLLLL
jgi:hypothetical protein